MNSASLDIINLLLGTVIWLPITTGQGAIDCLNKMEISEYDQRLVSVP